MPVTGLPDSARFLALCFAALARLHTRSWRDRLAIGTKGRRGFILVRGRRCGCANKVRVGFAVGLTEQQVEEDAQHLDDLAWFRGLDRRGPWLEVPAGHFAE